VEGFLTGYTLIRIRFKGERCGERFLWAL